MGWILETICLTIYGLLRTQSSPKASTLICVLDITVPESETRSVFHFRSFSSSPRSRESVSDFPGRIHGSIPPPFALSSRKKGREKSDHLNLSFRLLPAQISTFVFPLPRRHAFPRPRVSRAWSIFPRCINLSSIRVACWKNACGKIHGMNKRAIKRKKERKGKKKKR